MQEVKDFYDKYQYPKVKTYTYKQKKRHNKLLETIASYAGNISDKRVLDAGCGTGEKSEHFNELNARVVAIDQSLGQLKIAKSRCKDIEFYQKDILNLNSLKELGKFDVIFSIGVLHHTKDAKRGFYNLTKILNSQGIIVIALYHKYSRLRYRILRFLIKTFISKDPEEIMNFILNPWVSKPLRQASVPTLYDRYAVPFESYHTLKEVREWFKDNNLEEIKHSKNVDGFEPFKLFEKKSLFFVSAKKF